tara:strand:- start:1441 stop:1662 length:222 start_codon:yes stop_codon:yes gene_type:complete
MALSDATKFALGIATDVLETVSAKEPRLKAIPVETLAGLLANMLAPYVTDKVTVEEGSMEIGEGVEVDVVASD